MKTSVLLVLSILLLLVPSLARLYLLMPMPGSQDLTHSLGIAYFLHNWHFVARLLGLAGIAWLLAVHYRRHSTRILSMVALVVTMLLVGLEVLVMNPETMFKPMPSQPLQAASAVDWPDSLRVIGVTSADSAVAVPVYVVAYHHRIPLTLHKKQLWLTYCSMCGTGTAFDLSAPAYADLTFKLVGMNRYNALFEDEQTGSWWHQDTGEAVCGERTGDALPLYTSTTVSWKAWKAMHPTTRVIAPHPDFEAAYAAFEDLRFRTPPIRSRK